MVLQVLSWKFQLEHFVLPWSRPRLLHFFFIVFIFIVVDRLLRFGLFVLRATTLGGSATRCSASIAFDISVLRIFFNFIEGKILGQLFIVRGDAVVRVAPSLLHRGPRLFLGAWLRLSA